MSRTKRQDRGKRSMCYRLAGVKVSRVLMGLVVVMAIGCQNTPRIEVPRELTPEMTLYLNESVDSALTTGLFHEDYVPTGLPFGIKGPPRYFYYDTTGVVKRSIELGAIQMDRRLRGVTLVWLSHEEISPNPRTDSLSDSILSLLRRTYSRPFRMVEIAPNWFRVVQVVNENLKITVTLNKRRSDYECMVYFSVS